MTDKVDVTALHAAMDQKRMGEGLSWRQLAGRLGISPSTLSRMAQGNKPDVDSFAAIIEWLGVPAERFFRGATAKVDDASTLAMVSSHLRANKHLSSNSARALEQIIRTAFDALKDTDGDPVP